MDPSETLQRIRDLVNNEHPTNMDEHIWELHGLVRSLDNWLSRGGFLPDGWNGGGQGCPCCLTVVTVQPNCAVHGNGGEA